MIILKIILKKIKKKKILKIKIKNKKIISKIKKYRKLIINNQIMKKNNL
jgi:hypothetical protein